MTRHSFGLGVLGGMLPDIDADSSVPTRIIFGALAVVAAAAVALGLRAHSAPWLAASRAFHLAPTPAWLAGVFLTGGFLIHLALDELYSVDLLGARMKKSFGTALKLGSRRQLLGTAALYAGVIGLLTIAPPADRFIRDLTSSRTRAAIAATFAGLH